MQRHPPVPNIPTASPGLEFKPTIYPIFLISAPSFSNISAKYRPIWKKVASNWPSERALQNKSICWLASPVIRFQGNSSRIINWLLILTFPQLSAKIPQTHPLHSVSSVLVTEEIKTPKMSPGIVISYRKRRKPRRLPFIGSLAASYSTKYFPTWINKFLKWQEWKVYEFQILTGIICIVYRDTSIRAGSACSCRLPFQFLSIRPHTNEY